MTNAYIEPEGCELLCETCAPDGADGYPDGGGEADCPQCCGQCHEPLGNALTSDGVAYVIKAVRQSLRDGRAKRNTVYDCYNGTHYEGSRHCEIVRDWARDVSWYGGLSPYDEQLLTRYLTWTDR